MEKTDYLSFGSHQLPLALHLEVETCEIPLMLTCQLVFLLCVSSLGNLIAETPWVQLS